MLHFDIIETLGSGGNGTVYRAFDTHKNHMVALKTLKNVSEVTLNRFKREFLALKKMDNSGIVRVYDGFFRNDPPFFSMEWVKGKTLSHVIQDMENNPLIFNVADRETFAVRLAIKICDILAYIHGFDEIHRDLKPDNIFITLESGNILSKFHVKMLDFGLLKQVEKGKSAEVEKEEEDTEGGMIVGTVHYLSPEQAKGSNLDLRSDLYSLGVIIYKIISLKLPYEAKDVVGYIFKTVFEEPAPIEQHTPECSKLMRSLLKDLLSKEPSGRPPSASTLRTRLKGMLKKSSPKQLDIDASDLDFSGGIEGFGSPLLPPPLIGREDAIKTLEEQTHLLETQHPLTVMLTGEEGMGRSSVIKEWKSRISFLEPVFLQTHFSEEAIPTQDPIGMLMDSLIRNMKPEEVKVVFKDVYPFLSSVSRYLDRYFDTRSVGRFDHLSPTRKLQVLAVNFIKLIQNLDKKGPVIIILDDIQNSPERFFGWLTLFWEQVGNRRLMILLSSTPDPTKKAFNQFKERMLAWPESTEIVLKALDVKQTERLLQSMLPIGTELKFSSKLNKLIQERASGNPFYAIELFSRLYEDEFVFINQGKLDVKSTEDLDVPLSIHQALLKKLSRLPPESMTLLKVASVLGTSFEYRLLQPCLQWPEEFFLEQLMNVLKIGILSEEEEPAHKLQFNAPALQKILYGQISERDLQLYHNNAARVIEANLENNDVLGLEQVAFHYANGANNVRAIKFAYLAGNSALESKETEKAIYFYELSLEMMDKMENRQARNLVNLKLAEVYLANHQPEKAMNYYNESLRIDNLSKMEELRSLRGRMLCYQEMNRLEEAHADAQALCALGESCSNRIKAETLFTRGLLSWRAEGDAFSFCEDVTAASMIYPNIKNWQTTVTLAQILANDVLTANRSLQDLVKARHKPTFPIFLQLAALRYFMGDFKKAGELLSKAKVGGDEAAADPSLMVMHAALTYKIQSTVAPDHSSAEYLAIAERYIERFGLYRYRKMLTLIKLEHLLMTGQYEEAWKFTGLLVKQSEDLPVEKHMLHLFLCLTMRAAWEVHERPPRGWLIQFQKLQPGEHDSFTLFTHWTLARAAEAQLPLSMEGPKALGHLKQAGALLIKMKLKYYYRAILLKEIAILKLLGKDDQAGKMEKLQGQIDASLGIALPDK